MYFYTQLRQVFFQNIFSYTVGSGPESGSGEGLKPHQDIKDSPDSEKQKQDISPEDQARIDELQELKEELNTVLSSKKFVKGHKENLKRALINVKKLDPESDKDTGFQELVKKVARLEKEFAGLSKEGDQIDKEIREKMVKISGEAQGQIDKLKGAVGEGTTAQESTEAASEVAKAPEDLDKTQHNFSTQEVQELGETVSKQKTEIRKNFFGFIGEKDGGEPLAKYISHPKIQELTQDDADGLVVGYNIEDVIAQYDTIKESLGNDIQSNGEELSKSHYELTESKSQFDIVLRDASKIDGEKTLGEVRGNTVLERYKELLENNQKVKDILTPEDPSHTAPEFVDLNMGHIQALQEGGYDVKKLLLTTKDGKAFESEKLQNGDEFIVNVGSNSKLNESLDLSYITKEPSTVEVDGKVYDFKVAGAQKEGEIGVKESGYYNQKGEKLDIQDGTLVKVVSTEKIVEGEQAKKVEEELKEAIKYKGGQAIQEQLFDMHRFQDQGESMNVKTLPKGFIGKILAFIHNLFGKGKYEFNSSTGLFEMKVGSGEPITWGEFGDKVKANSTELGSLSARFESSSQGPYAYNPNDNGHGASYGSYQMNTNKGVYRDFIKKNGIAEGRAGWNAKIQEVGVEKFRDMEHNFIKQQNYDPMMRAISNNGVDATKFSPAMQNVIWSCAVQHGPGNGRILGVIAKSGVTPGDIKSEAQLINSIYAMRCRIWPAGINSRYRAERAMALSMLNMTQQNEMKLVDGGEMYDANIDVAKLENFTSYKAYKNPKTNVTQCSGTARLNFQKLGINVPRGSSAKKSYESYPAKARGGFPPKNSDAVVADLYLDASTNNKEYGHRVMALKKGDGKWYVCDPYYTIPGYGKGTKPIPAEAYIAHMKGQNGRRIWGAVLYGNKSEKKAS